MLIIKAYNNQNNPKTLIKTDVIKQFTVSVKYSHSNLKRKKY